MHSRTIDVVTDWETVATPAGYEGLHQLADAEFSGAASAGTAWAFLLNGRIIGVFEGDVEDFAEADVTAYRAADPSLPLLFAMQERGGETRANYYTNETPLTDVDQKLSSGGFTGYIELSENVLSGDYYVVYHGGKSMSAAFVGSSERLLTGEEAFETAADEVGIYEVIDVGVDIPQGDGLYLGIWGEITGLYPGVNVMENLLPYEGTSSIVPAMEQGEVDATIRSVASMRQWVEDGTLRPLLVGTTGDPPSAFSNAETFGTLGVNNADAASQVTFQTRPIVGPPDVPDEHVETLGDAILDVVESDGYERDVADAELTYGEFADGEGAKEAVRNKADQWSEYLDEAEKLLGALD